MYPLTNRIADLSMIWKQVSQVFPYFDQRKIDWDQLYNDYLSKVINAETEVDFHLLLARFVNELKDGHTDYSLPRALQDERGYLPFSLKLIKDTYCIDAAIPTLAPFVRQPVIGINGVPFTDFIHTLTQYCYHVDAYIPPYRIRHFLPFMLKSQSNVLETPLGPVSFDLLPQRPENLTPQSLQLDTPYQAINQGKLDIRLYENNLLYVRLDDFMYSGAADEVRAAISQTPDTAGIIIDLRENIGGMTMHGAAIAKLLISGTFHACNKRTRSMTGIALSSSSQLIRWSEKDIAQHIAAGYSTREEIDESFSYMENKHFDRYVDTYGHQEHTALFTGPCVLLTSRHTLSAAEDFVAMFRTNQRATIIGTHTSGTTGTPLLQTLSCGGFLRVCSVGYQLLDGTEFIGHGIAPDQQCEISLADYQRGYDSVLHQGLEALKKQK